MARERYSRLAPLPVEMEKTIATLAVAFFSPTNYPQFCQAIGKTPEQGRIVPFDGRDFVEFLEKTLGDEANKYIHQIRHLLDRLASNNILVEMGSRGRFVMIPKSYYALGEQTEAQSRGSLWLARSLGGRFVHHEVSPAIVQIVGKNQKGDERSGSGIVFDPYHVLTCRHVVEMMTVRCTQRFQEQEIVIRSNSIFKHNDYDVAVIRVDETLTPARGLVFLAPMIAQRVYTFGYPKVPNVRPRRPSETDAYLIMQSGEVTNEHVVAADRTELFLYSAITRPGDSGGAIISEDGYVVGMATNLTHGEYEDQVAFSPHYAAIPSHVLAEAVADMDLGVEIPYETFD